MFQNLLDYQKERPVLFFLQPSIVPSLLQREVQALLSQSHFNWRKTGLTYPLVVQLGPPGVAGPHLSGTLTRLARVSGRCRLATPGDPTLENAAVGN